MTHCILLAATATLLLAPCLSSHVGESPSLVASQTMENNTICASACADSKTCNLSLFDKENRMCHFIKCPNDTACQNLTVEELLRNQAWSMFPNTSLDTVSEASFSTLSNSSTSNVSNTDIITDEATENMTLQQLSESLASIGVSPIPVPSEDTSVDTTRHESAADVDTPQNASEATPSKPVADEPINVTSKTATTAHSNEPTNTTGTPPTGVSPHTASATKPTTTAVIKTTATKPTTTTVTTAAANVTATSPPTVTTATSTTAVSQTPPTTTSTTAAVKESPSLTTAGAHSAPAPKRSTPVPLTTSPRTNAGKEAGDTNKAILDVAAGPLTRQLVDTSSLLAVFLFGLIFFLVTVALFLTQAYDSFKKRDYTQVDYLINGMYSDSGV